MEISRCLNLRAISLGSHPEASPWVGIKFSNNWVLIHSQARYEVMCSMEALNGS